MFKINNEEWYLEFVHPFDPILRVDKNSYTYGVTIPEIHTIFIADDLRGDFLHHVLSHEISHAEFASRGLYLPVYIEECLADIIADNIVDVSEITNSIHHNMCKYYSVC